MPINPQTTFMGTGVTDTYVTDPSTGNQATVSQFHNSDNQTPAATAQGLMTGGVAQIINGAGNLDRQTETGADQASCKGIISGAMSMSQEVQATSTTTVAAGATSATLSVANTAGFQVGGALNFEPGTARYEQSVITATVANTSIAVQFPSTGSKYTHTANYTIQTFLFNQERDFSGEGMNCTGIGAAIATEFESNSGGPPLSSGLPSLMTLDADRNFQGKGVYQGAITSTNAGDAALVFSGNPWTSGLIVGQAVILAATQSGASVEVVTVSKNNTPQTGSSTAARTVNLVNPVVNAGSTYAQFDVFSLTGPGTAGASMQGVEDAMVYLYNAQAADPKKPLVPVNQAPGNTGAMLVSSDGAKATYRYAVQGFSPVATPTAFLVIQGSSTKTVRVKTIRLNGAATAAGSMTIQGSRWSTGGTLGSAVLTGITAVKHDVNDPAATATVSTVGTANYTTQGTGNGTLFMAERLQMGVIATGVFNPIVIDFCTRSDKAFVLRGTSDYLVLSGAGATVPSGGVIDITVEMEEDAS